MTAKVLQRVVAAVAFTAIGCGGGDDGGGNGPPPDGNDDGVECGDGTCTDGLESFGSCPEDCPAVVNCGNGACDGNEDYFNCADCACAGSQRCWRIEDLDAPVPRLDRTPPNACGTPNSLIGVLPGWWRRVDLDTGMTLEVAVDPREPDCGLEAQTPGDACVIFGGIEFILSEDSIYLDSAQEPCFENNEFCRYLDGRILDGGRRLEFMQGNLQTGTMNSEAWEKQ